MAVTVCKVRALVSAGALPRASPSPDRPRRADDFAPQNEPMRGLSVSEARTGELLQDQTRSSVNRVLYFSFARGLTTFRLGSTSRRAGRLSAVSVPIHRTIANCDAACVAERTTQRERAEGLDWIGCSHEVNEHPRAARVWYTCSTPKEYRNFCACHFSNFLETGLLSFLQKLRILSPSV